ncbi:hypothetical protein EU805_00740 [Salipiger sp. IMCC34102]|uniref:hypothetical protein n=1 Tax=Salipiger sp. IMCC34102 TaxID=2510647 RepID=UPI00101D4BCA|nr:hypothetical protein [Salipiger sp. IMCC34102]RYH03930.1 hypothetical protein EU805_00740 [Salipiger sp. IMCC34102]
MLSLLALMLPIALVGFVMTERDDDEDLDEQLPDDQGPHTGTGDLLDEIDRMQLPTASGEEPREDLGAADDRRLTLGTGEDESAIGEGDDAALFADERDDFAAGDFGDEADSRGLGTDKIDPAYRAEGEGPTANAGDTVTGEPEMNPFEVASAVSDDAPVVITDYEPGEVLAVELGDAAPEDVTTVQSDNGEEVEIRFKDEVIAQIQGITDPEDVSIVFMSDFDEP